MKFCIQIFSIFLINIETTPFSKKKSCFDIITNICPISPISITSLPQLDFSGIFELFKLLNKFLPTAFQYPAPLQWTLRRGGRNFFALKLTHVA